MSAVRLLGVDGLTLHVKGVDMIDGTPLLDLKPYVAVADSIPDAKAGWLLSADPIASFEVVWSERAREQASWLREHGVDLAPRVEQALSLGPEPHAYRRIKRGAPGAPSTLAVKEWRVLFVALDARRIRVESIESGYRRDQLERDPTLEVHRAFLARHPAG
jgi:hypothetical protein